jgi:hypothetical protein
MDKSISGCSAKKAKSRSTRRAEVRPISLDGPPTDKKEYLSPPRRLIVGERYSFLSVDFYLT